MVYMKGITKTVSYCVKANFKDGERDGLSESYYHETVS